MLEPQPLDTWIEHEIAIDCAIVVIVDLRTCLFQATSIP